MNIEDVLTPGHFRSEEGKRTWLRHLEEEYLAGQSCCPEIRYLRKFLRLEREFACHLNYCIYPEAERVFRALEMTPLGQVKVVVLGQDPYPNRKADGLAFSIGDESGSSQSLRTICKAIRCDSGVDGEVPTNGGNYSLHGWADQGVLLLNTVLSVRSDRPKSHYHRGWEKFTDKILEIVIQNRNYVVFLLWGQELERKTQIKEMINAHGKRHDVLCALHPGAHMQRDRDKFVDEKHFSKTNRCLVRHGIDLINWTIP